MYEEIILGCKTYGITEFTEENIIEMCINL